MERNYLYFCWKSPTKLILSGVSIHMTSKKTSEWNKRKLFLFSMITVLVVVLLLEVLCRISFQLRYKGLYTNLSIQGNTLQVSDSLLIFKNRAFYGDYDNKFQNNEEGMKSKV